MHFLKPLRRAELDIVKCYHCTELELEFTWFKWFKSLTVPLLPVLQVKQCPPFVDISVELSLDDILVEKN